MRVKTDERRNAIVKAATAIFSKVGYEKASMAVIAERAGASKTTLYGYFPSKEELFWAAMTGAMPQEGEEVLHLLDAENPNIAAVLHGFGDAYLRLFTTRAAIAVTRTAIAESATDRRLGELLYQRGPKRVLSALADYFSRVSARGLIGQIDPAIGAIQFKALLDAGIVEPLLFNTKAEVKLQDSVGAAVNTMLHAYGTKTS